MRKTHLIRPRFILDNVIDKSDFAFAEKYEFFAVSFVHSSCKKFTSIDNATMEKLIAESPKTLRKILIINETNAEKITKLIKKYKPQFIQLENEIIFGDLKTIKINFPKIQIIQTVYLSDEHALADAMEIQHFVDMLMAKNDFFAEKGNLLKSDQYWKNCREVVKQTKIPFLLNDNFNKDNITSAIELSRPFAITLGQNIRDAKKIDSLKFNDIIQKLDDYLNSLIK